MNTINLEILKGFVRTTIYDEESCKALENVTVEITNKKEVKLINNLNKLRVIFKPLEIEIKKGIAFCYLNTSRDELPSIDFYTIEDTLVVQLKTGKSFRFSRRSTDPKNPNKRSLNLFSEINGDIMIFYSHDDDGNAEKFFVHSKKAIFSDPFYDSSVIEFLNDVIIIKNSNVTKFYREDWYYPEAIYNYTSHENKAARKFEIIDDVIIIYKHRDTNIIEKIIDTSGFGSIDFGLGIAALSKFNICQAPLKFDIYNDRIIIYHPFDGRVMTRRRKVQNNGAYFEDWHYPKDKGL